MTKNFELIIGEKRIPDEEAIRMVREMLFLSPKEGSLVERVAEKGIVRDISYDETSKLSNALTFEEYSYLKRALILTNNERILFEIFYCGIAGIPEFTLSKEDDLKDYRHCFCGDELHFWTFPGIDWTPAGNTSAHIYPVNVLTCLNKDGKNSDFPSTVSELVNGILLEYISDEKFMEESRNIGWVRKGHFLKELERLSHLKNRTLSQFTFETAGTGTHEDPKYYNLLLDSYYASILLEEISGGKVWPNPESKSLYVAKFPPLMPGMGSEINLIQQDKDGYGLF